MDRSRFAIRFALASTLTLALVAAALAAPTAPVLNSRPGAAYTLYLNFTGFTFTGSWGAGGDTSRAGTYVPFRGEATSFTTAQQNEIRTIWARTAEKYAAFGVNVTTVDPAGTGKTDVQRQAFYDATPRVQHSIVSPSRASDGYTTGGVSYVGVLQSAYGTTANGGAGYGYHTNFIDAPNASYESAFFTKTTAETIAHEDGHAFGLNHQSDYNGNSLVREYSTNFEDSVHDFSASNTTNGSFAPVMGFSTFDQRGLFRVGTIQQGSTASNVRIQNDVAIIQGNSGIGGFYEDGIGNSFGAATTLALNGSNVNSSLAKGVVVPTSTDPSGYQGGYYKFTSAGGAVTLRATNGSSFIQAGVADPGMTLRNVLTIYDANQNLLFTGTEGPNTLYSQFSGNLAAGNYYALVTSTGQLTSTVDDRNRYYNMGSYFLSGSGFAQAVPEPASLVALAGGVAVLLRRRRKTA